MTKRRVLVVDDEEDILELIRYNLTGEGYSVACSISGEDALHQIHANRPDLIVLDLMLPGIDGLETCRRLKMNQETQRIPVIMLTAKGGEADIVTGLELGADDYITKPFSPRVLLARIKAVLRRRASEPVKKTEVIRIHDLIIDPLRHEVRVGDRPVSLTVTEFRILHFLARRPGWVFTRSRIVEGAVGDDVVVTDRSVDVHIVALRKKLGRCGAYIETVRGVGYRMKDD